jgi:quercetin dioxygenase-like cupin family protein
MVKPGDVLHIRRLGMRIVFGKTAAETGGELLEYDVIGRPRGFPAQRHLHPHQTERHEVVSGLLLVSMEGRERVLGVGESVVIPAGTAHRHYAAGTEEAHVRVELWPPLRTAELLERLAELSDAGQITKSGYLRPVATAQLIRDFAEEGRAAQVPAGVQRALSDGVLAIAGLAERAGREYVFVDEWDVDAPAEAVFAAVADATTYPVWWSAVYKDVEADGPPAVGQMSRHHFKGRLPYHLRTTSRIVELDPPRTVASDVVGDLRGHGRWTITQTGAERTHVRFDWRVFADRPLLKTLTPVLRPALRWNHNWSIARAIEGLEPYARSRGRP